MKKSYATIMMLCFIISPLICLHALDGPQTFMVKNLFNSEWGYFIDPFIQNVQRIIGILIIITIIGSLALYSLNALLIAINKKISHILIYISSFLLFIKPILWYLLLNPVPICLIRLDEPILSCINVDQGLQIAYEGYITNVQYEDRFIAIKMLITSAMHMIAVAILLLTLKVRKRSVTFY